MVTGRQFVTKFRKNDRSLGIPIESHLSDGRSVMTWALMLLLTMRDHYDSGDNDQYAGEADPSHWFLEDQA